MTTQTRKALGAGVLIVLSLSLLASMIASLRWKMVLDTPIMHYMAWLIDRQGYVPYKDIFDFNFPGAYVFHIAIGRIFGYGDFGFHIADLIWSSLIFALVFRIALPFGKNRAFLAVLLVGLEYFSKGPSMTLQRDWVILLFILIAVYIVLDTRLAAPLKSVLAGILFGAAASVKPHILIGLFPILVFQIAEREEPSAGLWLVRLKKALGFGFLYLAGILIPAAACAYWLISNGGARDFLDITGNYSPLYRELAITGEILKGVRAFLYSFGYTILSGPVLMKIAGAFSFAIYFFFNPRTPPLDEKRRAALLFGMAAAYILYTVPAGKFWDYHWMPAVLFLSMIAPLSLDILTTENRPRAARIIAVLPLIIYLPVTAASNVLLLVRVPFTRDVVNGVSDYLETHTTPQDRIQPLDWTGGAVQGMLQARRLLATRYLYDFCFYHHVSDPYIKKLRRSFIRALEKNPPDIILRIHERPWPVGRDTAKSFVDLKRVLNRLYDKEIETELFGVYRKRNVLPPSEMEP